MVAIKILVKSENGYLISNEENLFNFISKEKLELIQIGYYDNKEYIESVYLFFIKFHSLDEIIKIANENHQLHQSIKLWNDIIDVIKEYQSTVEYRPMQLFPEDLIAL